MPRTVDPDRYRARRDAILEAAYRQFAESGFDRTTTASICRAAGVSSGTFFHYFPTKLAALIGVLASGCEATRESLQEIERQVHGLEAVVAYAEAYGADLVDPSYGGFAQAVGGVESLPDVVAVLEEESDLVLGFILRNLGMAQEQGSIRRDYPADRLAEWVQWVFDGAAVGAASRTEADRTEADRAEADRAEAGPTAVTDALHALLLPAAST